MGVDLDELLVRVLPAALGRHVGHRTLHDLEQRLLHTLAGDVPRDGGIFALAGDLVDLVDIDDTALGQRHVIVRRLQQTQQDIFHIVADIAGLGQRGGIRNGKRDLQNARQRLGKERLARAGGTQHEDIALLQLDVVPAAKVDALIVVVYGHGQGDLRRLLPDDILIQHVVDLARRGQRVRRLGIVLDVRIVSVVQDLHAEIHALIADAHAAGALDHAVHFPLLLAAERAAQRLFVFFTH